MFILIMFKYSFVLHAIDLAHIATTVVINYWHNYEKGIVLVATSNVKLFLKTIWRG